jgi:predicted dithiol-disulfide oxidoreductase (DUF899 family)
MLVGKFPYEKVTCVQCQMTFSLTDPQEKHEVTTCVEKDCELQFWHTNSGTHVEAGLTHASRIRQGIEPDYKFIDRTPKGYGPNG